MPTMTPADKSQIASQFADMLDSLCERLTAEQSERDLERQVAAVAGQIGALVLSLVLSRQCAEETEKELSRRGLTMADVTMRKDANYHAKLTSVFGPILVCLYAFRAPNLALGKLGPPEVPAQTQFLPRYPKCRSTLLCLEWEVRLGADHPFRMAQDQLNFFTHEAVTLEDTTIAGHLINASHAVDASWFYKTPEQIAELLKERAMFDLKTELPVVYMSTDAHALRRFTDDTWNRQWKMINGVRIWAIDRFTGQIIHLGGEFTWGDCEEVAAIFGRLIEQKILPEDGVYGAHIKAQFVWISDGATWFSDRILSLFKGNIIQMLDVYHALEYASEFANKALPKNEQSAWKKEFQDALIVTDTDADAENDQNDPQTVDVDPEQRGAMPSNVTPISDAPKTAKHKARKGHKKSSAADRTIFKLEVRAARASARLDEGTVAERLAAIMPDANALASEAAKDADAKLATYVGKRISQMEYLEMQSRGLQIGSGAMESVHRTGSQVRLKRAGVTCLPETSQAILDWRMLRLSGRWTEYWCQPDLSKKLADNWDKPGKLHEIRMVA